MPVAYPPAPGNHDPMEVRWLSIMLDVPADRMPAACAFWTAATATTLGAPSGDDGEYLPLEPADGDAYLCLQRVGRATAGWHLDLHVDDLDAAVARATGLGAALTNAVDGLRVLATPGGQPFCFIGEQPARGGRRPAPPRFPGGRSLADQFCFDLPAGEFDRDADFWAALTGWPRLRRQQEAGTEFDRIGVPERLPAQFLFQRLGPDEADDIGGTHAHLDLSADDRDAEVERHISLGAEVVRSTEGWTTLRDPAGLVYCVTCRSTGVRITAAVGTPDRI